MSNDEQDNLSTLRAQLDALVRVANSGVFRIQLDDSGRIGDMETPGTWVAISPELLGLPPDTPVNFSAFNSKLGVDTEVTIRGLNDLIAAGTTAPIVRTAMRREADGSEVWIESRITIARDANGKPLHLDGVLRDVTQERRNKSDVRALGEFLRKLLLQVPVAIMRMEMTPGKTEVSDYANLTGNWIINASPLYGVPEGVITSPWQVKEHVHPEDRHLLADAFIAARDKGQNRYALEFRTIWPDGSVHWIDSRSIIERNPMGDVIALDGIQYDITDSKLQQERIAHMASHDVLTGLPNRALCTDTLERAVAAGRRYRREFAVMYLDLDYFKEVNDKLGHDVGDKLLIEVSQRFKNALRSSEFVARIGGDEFLVIAEQLTIPQDIDLVAGRLSAAAPAPPEIDGQHCQVSVSIGISIFPYHSDNGETLMKYADMALYRAKERGKNNYCLHPPED